MAQSDRKQKEREEKRIGVQFRDASRVCFDDVLTEVKFVRKMLAIDFSDSESNYDVPCEIDPVERKEREKKKRDERFSRRTRGVLGSLHLLSCELRVYSIVTRKNRSTHAHCSERKSSRGKNEDGVSTDRPCLLIPASASSLDHCKAHRYSPKHAASALSTSRSHPSLS